MYYDGTKLLSLKDINGDVPEIYICTSNRTGGKTTYFNRLVLNRFLKSGKKFCLVYRFKYELDNISDKFFKDVGELFFKGYIMKSEKRSFGIYHELFIKQNEENCAWLPCGYAVSLNSADQIKKQAHLLSDTNSMLFDEFQSETGHYCSNEVSKLISIHTSIARGQGEQVRYVPLYMIANPVSIINPYYVEMGIAGRLKPDTQFLRGEGWVLEQGYNESAAQAQKESGFNKAFSANKYVSYAMRGEYLIDNNAFIEKPKGVSRYLCTIKCEGREYAVREFAELGFLYCDDCPDTTFKHKIAVTTDDHNVNYVMLKRNEIFIMNLRYFFERGQFRFKNLSCKDAILKAISY